MSNFLQKLSLYKHLIIAGIFGILLMILRSKNNKIADLKMGAEQAAHEANIEVKKKSLEGAHKTAKIALNDYNEWLKKNGQGTL